jgi:hypothetical protein
MLEHAFAVPENQNDAVAALALAEDQAIRLGLVVTQDLGSHITSLGQILGALNLSACTSASSREHATKPASRASEIQTIPIR